MKVLFANPACRVKISDNLEKYHFYSGSRCPWSLTKNKKSLPRYAMFPFFMGYAAALLIEEGFETGAIDGVPLNLSDKEFMDRVISSTPDITVFEPSAVTFSTINKISTEVKNTTGSIIIYTGAHVTVCSSETMNFSNHIDFIIKGEYEEALCSLIKCLKYKKDYKNVDGLVYRDEEKIVVNEKKYFTDLNNLPFPARHLFPSKDNNDIFLYHDGFCQNSKAIQMHSSRGCKYSCSFCVLPQTMYKPGLYRTFDSDRVIEEITLLKKQYNAQEFYFDDDSFTLSKEHVLKISKKIRDSGLKIQWSVMGDAMNTDEEMLYEMKKSGLIGIKFGVESTDPNILKTIGKPLKINRLNELLKTAAKLKIKTHLTISFGHEGDTKATILKTLQDSTKLDSDSIQYSIATPYPGTRFYKNLCSKNKMLSENYNDLDPTSGSVVQIPGTDNAFMNDLIRFSHSLWLRKKIFNFGWLSRQLYFLSYILNKQGIKGLLNRIKRGTDILFSAKFK